MSDVAALQPTRSKQSIEAQDRSGALVVSGRLKQAIDAMVWEGLKRPEAAKVARMTDHGVREALRKPHVKAYYREQLQVLRESERARSIHRMAEIRDAADNMPAFQAARFLYEEDAEANSRGPSVASPGLVIMVVGGNASAHQIEHLPQQPAKPLIEHEDVHDDDQ